MVNIKVVFFMFINMDILRGKKNKENFKENWYFFFVQKFREKNAQKKPRKRHTKCDMSSSDTAANNKLSVFLIK